MTLQSATRTPRKTARAETVGSLLRPPGLRELFPKVFEGHAIGSLRYLDDEGRERLAELDRAADAAIAEAVQRQIDIGLDVVSDGELRRSGFMFSVVDALEGLQESTTQVGEAFTGEEGDITSVQSFGVVPEGLRQVDNPALREVQYLASLTDYPTKVTFPAPSLWYGDPVDISASPYETHAEFVEAIMQIERELIAEAVAAGARYVQIDWPAYVMAIDPKWRDQIPGGEGKSLEQLMDEMMSVDNAVIEGLPDDVTVALHICRGNFQSMWMTEGSLEPIAEQMFGQLRYDRLLVEWEDTDREGDYSPLRFVPEDGPDVVMGVVSSKRPEVESPEEVEALIHEAARYVDLGRLAVSPQCGFASSWEGNNVAEDIQWRKLEVVAEVADRIWGRD